MLNVALIIVKTSAIMLNVIYALSRLCCMPFMLSAIYAECHLCWALQLLTYVDCHYAVSH
jgi:hypothetical protein